MKESLKDRLMREHESRKSWKSHARGRMKKHYWMMVILCLIMAITGIGYESSLSSIKTNLLDGEQSVSDRVYNYIATGQGTEGTKLSQDYLSKKEDQNRNIGIVALEHTRGAAAELVNGVSSGMILTTLYEALQSATHSSSVSTVLFVILSALVVLFIYIFILNVVNVIFCRVFLESRMYDRVPMKRFLYLIRVKRWGKVAKTILLRDVYNILWYLTIIGGVIKGYSYKLVPYIAAENPDIGAKEAITLSRKMMDGHKLEAFMLEISFFPWRILGWITWGIGGIFFTNPYTEAVEAEFYASVRAQAIEKHIPGSEFLNDVYLYEKADEQILKDTYSDAEILLEKEKEEAGESFHKKGFWGFLRDLFGVTLRYDEEEMRYEHARASADRLRDFKCIMDGAMYPRRLFPLHEKDDIRKMSSLHYDRHYQITTLILMFFTICILGWVFEVSMHYVTDGKFANRGVLHGPWLPIYGTGCTLILILLNKFRKNPAVEFLAAIVVCGNLEYWTGWFLEMTHDGKKWWDYSGYFLNIHGRVCAEGLLVFGLGGLAMVYLIAPFLDNMFRRIPIKKSIAICSVLLVFYIGDNIYSKDHPNQGPGVTDIGVDAKKTESSDSGKEPETGSKTELLTERTSE